jgi:phage terminase large subunit GpA-like protein
LARLKKGLKPSVLILLNCWVTWQPQLIETVSEWAEKRRIMSKFDSPDAGMPWNHDKVPYAVFIMNLFSSYFLRKLVLKWATQTGKTNLMLNCIGYTMDERPGPCMIVYPTEKTVERASRTRLMPMINACHTLRDKKTRQWTVDEKHYHGGVLYLASSQSGSELSSAPIEVAVGDELKDWPAYTSAGKGGDPVKYLSDRQKQFPYTKKLLLVSSPSLEDAPINKHYQSCEALIFFFMPCPHCDELIQFEFDQIKFGKEKWHEKYKDLNGDDPRYWRQAKKHSYYECPYCKAEITNNQKPKMLHEGVWLDKDKKEIHERAESVGAQLSSIYSLDLKFGDIAHEFLESKRDREKLLNFKTGWLAEDWKEKALDIATKDILDKKCELERWVVPDEAVSITAGIDVQKHGFFYTVWAWSISYESWLIDYGFLMTWDDVESLVFDTLYKTKNEKVSYQIWRAAIDTGGGVTNEGWSKTEEIYAWIRACGRGVVWGVKGRSSPGKAKVNYPKKFPEDGVPIFTLDTAWLKDDFFWRLSDKYQPMHFHSETGEDFANHLLSEEKRQNKKGEWEWVQVKRDNHWLDASIYAHAAADPSWNAGLSVFGGKANNVKPRKSKPKQIHQKRIGSRYNYKPASAYRRAV